MLFEYSVTKTFTEAIDVIDAGNCALRCVGGCSGELDYYIIVKTVMGKTHIIKYGPICPDLPLLMEDFNVSYSKSDYKEKTIFKEIDKFINDFRKGITSVEEITEYEAWQNFPKIKNLFDNV